MVTPQQALWLELMQFYIREAWLLDERKFQEWLGLFTEDVLYFMPRRKNVPRRESHREVTPLGDLALIEDDKRYLEMRVARLETAWPGRKILRRGRATWSATWWRSRWTAVTCRRRPRSSCTGRTWRRTSSSSPGAARTCCAGSTARGKVAKRTIVLDANVLLDKNLSIFL
jgi:3-phenylpropionate/cinnamic acid dioxygenase small subunit